MLKYFIKQTSFSIVYLIFSAVCAIGVMFTTAMWLQIALGILNLSVFLVIIFLSYFKEGETALKVMHANDLERKEIIRTGEDRPLNLVQEYDGKKGLFMGLVLGAPLVILVLLHLLITLIFGVQTNGVGLALSIIYNVFFVFVRIGFGGVLPEASVINGYFYITLLGLPLIVLSAWLGYLYGAKAQQKKYDLIEDKTKRIYGE